MGSGPTTPRYSRAGMLNGGTGGRVMPGPSRSVKNAGPGNDRISIGHYLNQQGSYGPWYYENCQNLMTESYARTYFPNNTEPFQPALIGVPPIHVGGLGGGPNEPGSNAGNWTLDPAAGTPTSINSADNNGNTVVIYTHVNHWTPAQPPQTFNYRQNYSQVGGAGIPHYFGAWSGASTIGTGNVINGPTHTDFVSANADGCRSAGGGGWGAAGGSVYQSDIGFGIGIVNGQNLAGGAGGPAIKTNGNAVTFSGGQGTDRIFGAVA
jgi:hypothetical protein